MQNPENTPLNPPEEEKPIEQNKKHFSLGEIITKIFHSRKSKEIATFWLDIVLNIIIIVALVFLIRTYIISPFQVFGPSMCDTLNNINGVCQRAYGEYIIVNKFGYQNFFGWQVGLPERGDIVVFHPPHNQEEFFIKRVIGLPGETVKLQNGDVYIYNSQNPAGFKLPEKYLNMNNQSNTLPLGEISIFEVPQGQYLVFGDNRIASSDSRTCFKESPSGGKCGEGQITPFLPLDNIEGKAWVILWPLSKISLLQDPVY
jgi:signal peptidase I